MHQQREHGQRQQRQQQPQRLQVVGVEQGDDGDRQQVVDHGQGEQERPQRGRQMGGDDRENGQREGDVGGGGDRPALRRRCRPRSRRYSNAGDDHPADRGGHRHDGAVRVPQVTGHELAFEFQPGDEEEDRQQPVGGPLREGQVQMQRGGTDLGVQQL